MKQDNESGKIVTFYSFKGGVGRTMAVANLAFLAAMNGKRVLVMDWDLEAPGLAYYFRGLLDAVKTRELEDAPGVIDILSEWSVGLGKAETEIEIGALQQRFIQGVPFQNCMRSLVEPEMATAFFPASACLDIMSAGAKVTESLDGQAYEETLAQFSWQDFFEKYAGGFVLENLRLWAKQNYDFVFIDSRTGLADIAGVCTMQLPDVVALCFALNKQNIDGIAKVAAAISAKRADEVTLRVLPMRVAQSTSADKSDAQAHVESALTHIAGLASNIIKIDIEMLSIPLVDDLPFYETLAPIIAKDPAFDPLTLSYLRLGNHLLDASFTIPTFNKDMLMKVKQRLLPRISTVEYLSSLKLAEPTRAMNEFGQLVDSAYDTVVNGGMLGEEYVLALVNVGIELSERSDDERSTFEVVLHILDILRILKEREPDQWLSVLATAIENFLEYSAIFNLRDDERPLMNELDELLSNMPSANNYFKRFGNLRNAARVSLNLKDVGAFGKIVDKIQILVENVSITDLELSSEQKDMLLVSAAEMKFLKGQFQSTLGNEDVARQEYENGLNLLIDLNPDSVETELGRLRFRLHYQLATSPIVPAINAASHAVEAIQWSGGSFFRHYLLGLAGVVLSAPENPEIMMNFCEAFLFKDGRNKHLSIAQYYGRQPKSAVDFLEITIKLLKILFNDASERACGLSKSIIQILSHLIYILLQRNVVNRINVPLREKFEFLLSELINLLEEANFPLDDFAGLIDARNVLNSSDQSNNTPLDGE